MPASVWNKHSKGQICTAVNLKPQTSSGLALCSSFHRDTTDIACFFLSLATVCGLDYLTTTFRKCLLVPYSIDLMSFPSSRSIVMVVNDWILGFCSHRGERGGDYVRYLANEK